MCIQFRIHQMFVLIAVSKTEECTCKLLVKNYPRTDIILGEYSWKHTHHISSQNLKYICIQKVLPADITTELHAGMDLNTIVSAQVVFWPNPITKICDSRLKDFKSSFRLT